MRKTRRVDNRDIAVDESTNIFHYNSPSRPLLVNLSIAIFCSLLLEEKPISWDASFQLLPYASRTHLGHTDCSNKKYCKQKLICILCLFVHVQLRSHCATHTFQGRPLFALITGLVLPACLAPVRFYRERPQHECYLMREDEINTVINLEVLEVSSTAMSSSTCTWATRAINGPAPAPRYSKVLSLFFCRHCRCLFRSGT